MRHARSSRGGAARRARCCSPLPPHGAQEVRFQSYTLDSIVGGRGLAYKCTIDP